MSYKVTGGKPYKISLSENDTIISVLQNISMILSTKKGTVPMYREFGLPMDFVDKPIPIAKTLIVSEVTEALRKFEPRATVIDIKFESEDITGKVIPVVEVDINDEQED